MNNELSHSFNVRLTPEIFRRLCDEQKLLADKFKEMRSYDSSPHLAIATKFMGINNSKRFADALETEFASEQPWELIFTDFRPSDTGDYIFLHLAPESEKRLLTLHKRALRATRDIGLEEQTTKQFRSFVYRPHISIMKLEQTDVPTALALIARDLTGTRMPVTTYELTRQKDDEKGFASFPIIRTFDLNPG